MKRVAHFLVTILVCVVLLAGTSAAAAFTSAYSGFPQISSPNSLLSGFNPRDPATMQPFITKVQGLNLTPPPEPRMSMDSYDGKYSYNWGEDRFKPGGTWISEWRSGGWLW